VRLVTLKPDYKYKIIVPVHNACGARPGQDAVCRYPSSGLVLRVRINTI